MNILLTHLAIAPVFQKVDNTLYQLDKSLSTFYYYFILCLGSNYIKEIKVKYIYCLAPMSW